MARVKRWLLALSASCLVLVWYHRHQAWRVNENDGNQRHLQSVTRKASYRPHILFVVMDDLGSNDLGYHGSGISTPVADKLASKGVILKNFYTLPTCSTTRMALMTGRYPYRMGQYEVIRAQSTDGMPENEETVAEILRRTGYQTHAVGKWHLGHARYEQTPTFRGFQSFFGFHVGGKQHYFKHTSSAGGGYDLRRETREYCGAGCSRQEDHRGEYSSFLYAKEAATIVDNYQARGGPLFLYLAFQAVHLPMQVPSEYFDMYDKKSARSGTVSASGPIQTVRHPWLATKQSGTGVLQRRPALQGRRGKFWGPVRKAYAGMLTAADEALGEVVAALQRRGIWEDTLVVYMTDNGGTINGKMNYKGKKVTGVMASNLPSRGGKRDVWEGGVLGEGFIGGPAVKKLGFQNKPYKGIFHTVDWLPTLVEMTDGDRWGRKSLDGVSHWDALRGRGKQPRNLLFLGYSTSHGSDHGKEGPIGEYAAIRWKKWKLLRLPSRSQYELYDLRADPEEKKNVAKKNPSVVRFLQRQLRAHEKHFKAPVGKDKSCPAVSFKKTPWGEQGWEPWC